MTTRRRRPVCPLPATPHHYGKAQVPLPPLQLGPSLWMQPAPVAKDCDARVALPEGCGWFDFWTGQLHPAATLPLGSVPLERLPLFVRAGSILPLAPAARLFSDQLEIRIYAGASCGFTMNFEGESLSFVWDDAAGVLSVSPGATNPAASERPLRLTLVRVRPGWGAGIDATLPDAVVEYAGEPLHAHLGSRERGPTLVLPGPAGTLRPPGSPLRLSARAA